MTRAARRFFLGLAVVWSGVAGLLPAEPLRSAPTRPGASPPPPKTPPAAVREKSGGNAAKPVAKRPAPAVKTISLSAAAAKLGLKLSGDRAGRAVWLSDATRRMEFEIDSREARIDGLRFFLGEPITERRGTFYVSRTDYETCLVPLLRPALITPRIPVPDVIALDPGHGGNDAGTQNPRLDLNEKVFTLDVALRVKKLLRARGYKVVLTRDSDKKVELLQRALIANRAKADLFVSIHFNSLYPDTKTSGAEVFTFTRAGQRSDHSRGLGQDDDTEDEPAPVNRFDAWSVALAQSLHRETISALKLPDRGHKTKHLGVLRGLNCPGALVESGFLSHDGEAKKIATPEYRQKIAEALAAGIQDYAAQIKALRKK